MNIKIRSYIEKFLVSSILIPIISMGYDFLIHGEINVWYNIGMGIFLAILFSIVSHINIFENFDEIGITDFSIEHLKDKQTLSFESDLSLQEIHDKLKLYKKYKTATLDKEQGTINFSIREKLWIKKGSLQLMSTAQDTNTYKLSFGINKSNLYSIYNNIKNLEAIEKILIG